MIDIAIVGAGPAGYSAAITARKRDKSVVVIGQHTGWLSRAHSISNYPGLPDISGADLLNAMRDQAVALGAQTRPGVVHQIVSMGSSFALSLGGDFIEAKHIILCTGAKQPRLLPGESELLGRGVSYCGTCDGMFYRGKRVAVIDAGGTNFRVATVHYEFGQPILEDERTLPMPGSERDADWMDFIRLAADALEPLLDRVTQIGICFSYPAENTPELDAKVLGMTKEVQLTGWEDHLVGADLAEELERRGCTKLPITVINDTPATYLSGSTTIANNYANGFAGLVNGTGTNTCCLLPVRAIEKLGRDADGEMLVNLESGSFTDVPQSAFDKALDAASAAPGAYRFEKMTSGRYLGKLSRLALIAAAKDGLFAPETADKLRALDVLTAADADAFGADPDCGAIAALSDAADADRKTAAMVIQSVFGRAAKAIVANIAAIVFLTDGAKNRYRPMVVAVDGSLFRYSTLLRPAVSEELEAFLVQKHQRYCVCKPVPNASAIGTAAASLLQD